MKNVNTLFQVIGQKVQLLKMHESLEEEMLRACFKQRRT